LINQYPANTYLKLTWQDNTFFAQFRNGEVSVDQWQQYLKNDKHGHIASFYISLQDLKGEKNGRELNNNNLKDH
jgi:hypothetical protein